MRTPRIFGFLLYSGVKHRVAKKHLLKWWYNYNTLREFFQWCKSLENVGVNDYVLDCNNVSRKILSLDCFYIRIGNGRVLTGVKVNLDGQDHICSAKGCNIHKVVV